MIRLIATMAVTMSVCALPSPGQTLGLGDPAPKLNIEAWVKGEPVDMAKGKGKTVYVLEFWGTWCPPCLQVIPHLSEVQRHYKNKNVVVVAISDEAEDTVASFVKKSGNKIDYTVAVDRKQATTIAYMAAAEQMGIPTTFIINREGQIAWIGSPFVMDTVLEEIVSGRHDIEQAKAESKAEERFFRDQYVELRMAMEGANWARAAEIGRAVATPRSGMSKRLRSQILHSIAWTMLADERANERYFKEALYLAKSAYDFCGCDEPSIIDTYARALFDNGRAVDAVQYQQEAVDLSEAGMMKSELLSSLKRYEEAAKSGD